MATVNNIPAPSDLMMAQYSLPFCVALAHHHDARDPASFNLKSFNDPAIRSLAQRVTITVADEAKHGHTIASTVTVTLKDGRMLSRRVDSFKGTPEQPLDRAEMREKFLLLTRHCDGKAMARLFERLQNIENEKQPRLAQGRCGEEETGCANARHREAKEEMTETIGTQLRPADFVAIADAALCLADGGLVAFPTETVYGLGADATNAKAVARLYAAKGRPSFNPLIAHVFDLAAAKRLAVFDAAAEKLAAAFWPGPLTLVLKKRAGCPVADLATAGLDSIAVRVPAHPVAQGILNRLGRPVVAPSANRSGHVSPTTAQHVMDDLGGRIDFIIDGGPTSVGVEVHHRRLPRPPDAAAAGRPAARADRGRARRHRSRTCRRARSIRTRRSRRACWNRIMRRARGFACTPTSVNPGEALLAFGTRLPPGTEDAAIVLNLSPGGDLVEAAANLFSDLRTLDQSRGRDHRRHAGAAATGSARPSTTGLRARPRRETDLAR